MRPLRLLLPVLLLSLSCRTAAPSAAGQPPSPVPRVLVLSLDGAAAETLQRLWREGAFGEDGFRQFFEDGQVADRLVPVDPTLTAVNHISLATGFAPEATGIVSNRYHPQGAPFLDTVSGFEAPIGTETLWEAAKRQGKRVGIVTWPGADARTERRKADWGLIYVNDDDAKLEPAIVALSRSDWSPVERSDVRLQGLRSFAPILQARLPPRGLEIAALDRKDDGKAAYDTLVPLVPPAARTPLARGDWGSVPCAGPPGAGGAEEGTTCLIKVLEMAPDLSAARIYLNGVYANAGYPDAFAQAFTDSGLLWPGPPDNAWLSATWQGKPGIDLTTWVEQAERFTGFFGAALRFAAARDDWDLLMGYIPTIDEAGHQLLLTDPRQPGFTPERRAELAQANRRVWQEVDRELAALLRVLDLRETRIVVVSDHGMLPVHTMVDPNVPLRDKGLLAAENGKIADAGTTAWTVSAGGCAHVYVRPDAPDRAQIVADLKALFTGWTLDNGDRPVQYAVLREEAGEIGLDHPNSGDLILFAASGYAFTGSGLRQGRASLPTTALGMHGNRAGDGMEEPDLNGIYLALGAGLRKGNAGTVRNVEVAKRVAEWLGIEAPRREPPTP
jgi:predicted AlkP superfamily pyrophosphatase or phosphodiesterase